MTSSSLQLGIVILAAGESKRLGTPKQLLDWNGETLLQKSIATANQLLENNYSNSLLYVVLGAKYEEISAHIRSENVVICQNKQWVDGIGSSIRCGIEEMSAQGKCNAALIMLCDQPYITSDYLQKLVERFIESDKGIITTSYNKINGVPALFDKKYFAELCALRGEQGAKQIIKRFAIDCETVDFEKAAIDIDTSEDYVKALRLIIN